MPTALLLLADLSPFTGDIIVTLPHCSYKIWIFVRVELPCSVFEAELADHIPVIRTSIAGTRLVGRMTVGALAEAQVSLCVPAPG